MFKEDKRLVDVIKELLETYTPDEVVEHLLSLLENLDTSITVLKEEE